MSDETHSDETEQIPAGTSEVTESVEAAARKSPLLLDAPATYALLAINFIVFLVMLPSGPFVKLFHAGIGHGLWSMWTASFDPEVITKFGGCDGYQVLDQHSWWLLLTATFVHITLLHLLVNMWCLWNLGLLGEPLLGWRGLLATYGLTGIAGNLLSLAVHTAFRNYGIVAGASGAIFGIAGILIILLSNRRLALPWDELKSLRRSVIQFAVLNLLLGLAPDFLIALSGPAAGRRLGSLARVDNMAHLGGFAAGLAMGWPLFSRMMAGRKMYRARQRETYAATAWVLLMCALIVARMHAHWAAAVKFR